MGMRQIFVTGRSIYHVRDNVVTKVADRKTQRVSADHAAQGAYLAGGFATGSIFAPTSERSPRAGEHLCFAGDSGTVISSPVDYVLHVHESPAPDRDARTDLGFDEDDEVSSSYAGR